MQFLLISYVFPMSLKVISKSEFSSWKSSWDEEVVPLAAIGGGGSGGDFDRAREQKAAQLEKNLELLGVTAVEDQLQVGEAKGEPLAGLILSPAQDSVCRSMSSLLSAGLRVWLLTGDRQENAVSVARASGLVSPGQPVLLLPESPLEESRAVLGEHVQGLSGLSGGGCRGGAALVLAGEMVGQCAECSTVNARMRRLLGWATVVICYRVGAS